MVNDKIRLSYSATVDKKFSANNGRPKDILVDSLGKFIMFRLVDYLCRYERTCQVQNKQSIRSMTKKVAKVETEELSDPREESKGAKKSKVNKEKLPITKCFEFYSGIKTEKGFYVAKIVDMKERLEKEKKAKSVHKETPKLTTKPEVHETPASPKQV